MAAKYYTVPQLKELALASANAIGLSAPYGDDDVDGAYDFAVSLCGYENPASSDSKYLLKQRYLIEAMSLFFFKDVQKKYLLKFDVGDLKLGQVGREVRQIIDGIEASLLKAREDPATASLFIKGSNYFGKVVVKPGIADDLIGQSIDPNKAKPWVQ